MYSKKIAFVSGYIRMMKGVNVKINIRNDRDLMFLEKSYFLAKEYFRRNNIDTRDFK